MKTNKYKVPLMSKNQKKIRIHTNVFVFFNLKHNIKQPIIIIIVLLLLTYTYTYIIKYI